MVTDIRNHRISLEFLVPASILVRRSKLLIVLLAAAPALLLGGCSKTAEDELQAKFTRAEAAALRAENAQKAAEAAAARAENDKIAAAHDAVDFAKPERDELKHDDRVVDPNADQASSGDTENRAPG